jgi:uncharacterized membrane protein
MQRKIFSVNPCIPQAIKKIGRLTTFLCLFITTVCTHIILTSSIASASDTYLSAEENERGTMIFFLVFVGIPVAVVIVLLVLAVISAAYEAREKEKRDKEMKDLYNSLSPEQQREADRSRLEFKRELADTLREMNQEKHLQEQRKEDREKHQKFLRKMEDERFERERKIRVFRDRYGREPYSHEI